MSNPEMAIVVPLAEYLYLIRRDDWLQCLEAAGVDNWNGMEEAVRIRDEGDE